MSIERKHTGLRMSQLVISGPVIFMAGQVATDAGRDIAGQTQEVLAKIEALLAEGGTDRSRLLSVTIYLSDMADFQAMNAVWDQWIADVPAPARACVEARLARPELLVEMSVTASR